MTIPEGFHFLRPEWFYALLPLALLLWMLQRGNTAKGSWSKVCDTHLLPHLLVKPATGKRRNRLLPLLLLALGWLLAVTALAGPTWSKQPQPVFKSSDSRIIVLDLSRSMDATDIKPSRLTRAKYKVLDILKASKEGKTGLIVFSNLPYVVSPLTEDAATIAALVPTLSSDLMPRQGSRPDLALEKADQLLTNGGAANGNIILITDSINDAAIDMAKSLQEKGRTISVLATGTPQGAPIPAMGGFVKDRQGAIVVPKLDRIALQRLASQGSGVYSEISVDDSDIQTLLANRHTKHIDASEENRQTTDIWHEEGPWLILLILPLALFALRRGWLASMVLFITANTIPQPAVAIEWDDLWSHQDQQAFQLLKQGDAAQAAAKFEDPAWQGTAYYQAGDYERAAQAFAKRQDTDGYYNLGNALAKAQRYPEAIAAYEKALSIDKDHADAKFNLELVKKLLDKQQSSSADDGSESNREDDSDRSGNGNDSPRSSPSDDREPENGQTDENTDNGNRQHSGDQDGQQKDNTPQKRDSDDSHSENDDEKLSAESRQTTKGLPQNPQQEGDERPNTIHDLSEHDQKSIESERALEHWLRQIPDDPGGLLRRKFNREYQRQQYDQEEMETW